VQNCEKQHQKGLMKTSKKKKKNARCGNKQQGERRLAQLKHNNLRILFAISQVKIDN
jgi:hypothetical protein